MDAVVAMILWHGQRDHREGGPTSALMSHECRGNGRAHGCDPGRSPYRAADAAWGHHRSCNCTFRGVLRRVDVQVGEISDRKASLCALVGEICAVFRSRLTGKDRKVSAMKSGHG
jgi:hypothetical protein